MFFKQIKKKKKIPAIYFPYLKCFPSSSIYEIYKQPTEDLKAKLIFLQNNFFYTLFYVEVYF